MKAIIVDKWLKGPEELVVKNVDLPPEPKKGELQIQVKATGLNFFDILMVQGKYQIKPPFPFVPGGEFAGIVLKSTVPQFKAGDRVFGSGNSFAEVVNVSASNVLPMPKNFSFEEAAGLYITYPTSYSALVLRANLKAGEYCLVHAAAGGVGIAAVQIAKALGAKVIATAGTSEKLEIAKKFGADYAINYRDKDWPEQVKKITNGHGADVVYDPVGLVETSTKCTAWNGRILIIGFAQGTIEKIPTNRLLLKNISAVGLHWGAYTKNEPERIPEVWRALFELFESGKLKPALYKTVYNLETISQGLKAIGDRSSYAKVVAKIGNEESKL
ncbi:NAD(P)-binding protein [Rhizopus microsporus ATCC 52813]|uniref:NAD(P)-binding protein n=1 Tax=Rhizopus microsporus ATCC 52813 TaxID=1340429 RepID=A0A2G4SJ33_RHIZD|nr:NAD(P)-binding protein [Rhizopus microsporus ATCC 52813]PHZ08762.1 NAD(P)-binding protein [Rhizopus microsporus ATCC 52813]